METMRVEAAAAAHTTEERGGETMGELAEQLKAERRTASDLGEALQRSED